DAVLGTIRMVAGIVLVAAQVVSAIVPYTVTVQGLPGYFLTLPVAPDPPIDGEFRANVTAGDIPDWPDVVRGRADQLKVKLPSLKPSGNPITWGDLEFSNGLLSKTQADSVLDEDGNAVMAFTSIVETPEQALGDPHSTTVRMQV